MIEIKARRLHPEAKLPKTWSDQACGLDLHALVLTDENRRNKVMIPPNMTMKIRTGISIECPRGYYAAILSRSGMAASKSMFVTNSPGIIDPDYRGELLVMLYNGGVQTQWIEHHDRVGQLIILPFLPAMVREVTELSETERGTSGLGSTGR